MSLSKEEKDKKEARTVAIALIALVIVLGVALIFAIPILAEFNEAYLASGLGLKDSAVISFVITVIVLIIFAVAAGDGLIGELQFMLIGFFAFFLVTWLLLAWVF